ncbi:MAG TPA: family 31 glucosidase, partial [Clostridium sp.]|nr:family 31 glucosidase [Clostridium sp.]
MSVFRKENNCLKFHYDAEELWIQPWGANSFRVRASKMDQMQEEDWALSMKLEDMRPEFKIEKDFASIRNGK